MQISAKGLSGSVQLTKQGELLCMTAIKHKTQPSEESAWKRQRVY